MSTIDINELKKTLPDPFFLGKNLNSINQQFKSILDDFKKYYILHNQNPQYNEYTQLFDSNKSNVHKIQSQLFSEMNSIELSVDKINQALNMINVEIEEEKLKNIFLKQKLNDVNSMRNGASEMSDNYKTMYNLQYFSNFTMFLGILIAAIMTYNVFKKKNTN